MATAYVNQLQPYEEQTSPSPVHEDLDPFDRLSLTRSRSPPSSSSLSPAHPSLNRGNSLHRQLSGDPDSPPPAWKRRPTINKASAPPVALSNQTPAAAAAAAAGIVIPPQPPASPSSRSRTNSGPPPSSRRHPSLMMTSSASSLGRAPLPSQLFMHESSPRGSSTSLNEMDLPLPQPAFRRQSGRSSARSSITSSADLTSMTSEDLWALGQETAAVPDMSNPDRQAAERPLDTIMGLDRGAKRQKSFRAGLPVDVIWPEVSPAETLYEKPSRAKSFTNVVGLGQKAPLMSRKKTSRQPSVDSTKSATVTGLARPASMVYAHGNGGRTEPSSPNVDIRRPESMFLSSAHSSTTDLSNAGKPQSLSRPPSTYYSRDFLSSLAPREGGYAIAAMMGGGLGAIGTMTVEEKRRSTVMDEPARRPASRAPAAKSTGMGRWSLDGGEHYGNRPYGNASPATTTSNLSTYPPVTSPDPSPPASEDSPPFAPPALPEGAMPPMTSGSGMASALPAASDASLSAPVTAVNTAAPLAPSPLSRAVSEEPDTPATPAAATTTAAAATVPVAPAIPATAPAPPALAAKKSAKELKKEAKEAAKANELKIAREAAAKKQAAKDAEARAKLEAKRKEKDEKAKKKAEKAQKAVAPITATPPLQSSSKPATASSSSQTGLSLPKALSLRSKASAANLQPAKPQQQQHQPSTPAPAPVAAPDSKAQPATARAPPAAETTRRKLGFFGTMKKRFSVMGGSSSSSARPHARAQSEPVSSRPAAQAATAPVAPQPTSVAPKPLSDQPEAQAAPTVTSEVPDPMPASVLAPRTTSLSTPPRPLSAVTGSPASFASSAVPYAAVRAESPLNDRSSPSRELHASGSVRRRTSSVAGPRPMPGGRDRSISNASKLSRQSASSPTGHSHLPPQQQQTFPVPPIAAAADAGMITATEGDLGIAKTSSHLSSVESADRALSSTTATTASSDLATPMFSSESEGSHSSFTSVERDDSVPDEEESAAAQHGKDVPARENSNETIHASAAMAPAPVVSTIAAH